MNDLTLFISKEDRQHHPYRSLYAALLFQSFRDALTEAMPTEDPTDRDAAEAVSRNHPPLPLIDPRSSRRRKTGAVRPLLERPSH
jgi:hypothetical protein